LLIDPFTLFDVGFQLSYLAVIGIVLIYPKLYSLIDSPFVITRMIWKICCLSLSAQIATAGISIFYFNQFPSFFLLSNIFLFPLVPIILVSGFSFFILGSIPLLGEFVFYLLQSSIQIFNFIVLKIESLPFSLIDYLFLDLFQLMLIYLIVVSFVLFLHFKKIKWLNTFLFIIICFQLITDNKESSQIVFYSIDNHSAILFYENNSSVLLVDSMLVKEYKLLDYSLDGHFSKLSVNQLSTIYLGDIFESKILWKDNFHFQFLNKKGLIVHNDFELLKADSIIDLDYCLLTKNIDISQLYKSYAISLLIIDASMPNYTRDKLVRQCKDLGVKYHNLKHSSLVERL